MNKLYLAILLFFLTNTQVVLADSSLKQNMRGILNSFSELIPYIYNGKSLNDKEFIKNLNQFETTLKETGHYELVKQEGFRPNLKIIKSAIREYTKSAKQKNYYFARQGLKTLANRCANCHSQLPRQIYGKIKMSYDSFLKEEIYSSYDSAVIAYLLRDYKKAINDFSTAVKEHQHDPQIQGRSIEKILKISLMQNFNLKQTRKKIIEFKKHIKPGTHLAKNVDLWGAQLTKFKKPLSGEGISSMVKKVLVPIEKQVRSGDPNLQRIPLYYMQGVISRNMLVSKKNDPMGLYWLGIIENSFHEDFMFSLGDIYLKTCIRKYSASPFAQKCYDALEESYTFGFTGSSGTSLPENIKVELKGLKNQLFKQKTKK